MKDEKKEKKSTIGKILKGLGILALVAGTGLAIYDHREKIGNTCKKVTGKLFKKNTVVKETVKPGVNNNNPRKNVGNYKK